MFKFLGSALVALFIALAPAQAITVYFACGEDVCFALTGSSGSTSTSGNYRSTYSRGSIDIPNTSSPAVNYVAINGATGLSSFWLSARVKLEGACMGANATGYIGLTTDDAVTRIFFGDGGCGSTLTLYKRDSAGSTTNLAPTSSCIVNSSVIQKWDIQIVNYGASGTIRLHLDGALCVSYTGNIATDSKTVLNGIRLGPAGASTAAHYSEVVVSDTDTRSVSVQTLQPSGAGTNQTWTCSGGTTYGSINAFDNSADSNNCTSGTNNQKETFTVPSLVAGTYQIWAVAQAARANVGASGPQNFKYDLRVSGTDYQSSDVSPAPSTSLQNLKEGIWNTNPATSAAWVSGDFSGIEMGFQSSP